MSNDIHSDAILDSTAHTGWRLYVEERLTAIYGPGLPVSPAEPDRATRWAKTFRFGAFDVFSSFVLWPDSDFHYSDSLGIDVDASAWEHSDSEVIKGYYNGLKLVELLTAGIAALTANPPQTLADVTAVFDGILHHAYHFPPE